MLGNNNKLNILFCLWIKNAFEKQTNHDYFIFTNDNFSVGTHGYMAPEVLSKGTAYDSSADWFSFGCMLYKLLKGHSPFRQHKTKDKHEIDRMTLTMNVELPDTFSIALRQLLEGLLQVGPPKTLKMFDAK